MSHLQYHNYEGIGEKFQQDYWYSQAVRVGDRIEGAGQGKTALCLARSGTELTTLFHIGGWDPKTGAIPADTVSQIDQAFRNVDLNLKQAGGKGWEQVFRVTSYHVPMDGEALGAMVRNFKQWMPNHQPIWTCLGVSALAQEAMKIEIEVVAHDA